MALCYISFTIHTHAFLIERSLKQNSIPCEMTYLPRDIIPEPCNLGVRFDEYYTEYVKAILRQSKIPKMRMYKEVVNYNCSTFLQIDF